jgi:hypothetical protein
MVHRIYATPFSGSKGESDANKTRSDPKNLKPSIIASFAPKSAVSASPILLSSPLSLHDHLTKGELHTCL